MNIKKYTFAKKTADWIENTLIENIDDRDRLHEAADGFLQEILFRKSDADDQDGVSDRICEEIYGELSRKRDYPPELFYELLFHLRMSVLHELYDELMLPETRDRKKKRS